MRQSLYNCSGVIFTFIHLRIRVNGNIKGSGKASGTSHIARYAQESAGLDTRQES